MRSAVNMSVSRVAARKEVQRCTDLSDTDAAGKAGAIGCGAIVLVGAGLVGAIAAEDLSSQMFILFTRSVWGRATISKGA